MNAGAGRPRAAGHGLDALRRLVLAAVEQALLPQPLVAGAVALPTAALPGVRSDVAAVAMTATAAEAGESPGPSGGLPAGTDDSAEAASSSESPEERARLIALVELARAGDKEAFGLLYDHYQPAVYRFLFYRTRSVALAEDLTSETFFRALRRMSDFRWQGKDFGAWLTTIARNLATDHFKAGRTRLEHSTDDMGLHDDGHDDGPESTVLTSITNELLMEALGKIPAEQQDCLVMRFLQGLSIAETAAALGRSEGAVKQLQLRGVRNLAKLMPEGMRG